ncbi:MULTISPECIES: hypothetical protein [Pseudomonas]|uniref:hypothetical protein n=1 Tax=Pseudomonas TaxID=286 RepID=UPI0011848786|nr:MULTISPECIES: hypothetical protein [Pseudomonas]
MFKFKGQGIEIIALADHNSGDWIDDVVAAGAKHGNRMVFENEPFLRRYPDNYGYPRSLLPSHFLWAQQATSEKIPFRRHAFTDLWDCQYSKVFAHLGLSVRLCVSPGIQLHRHSPVACIRL